MAYGVMVAVSQPISGGHVNPAVTFALLVAGRLSLITGAAYMVAQTMGAIVGGWIVKVVTAPWMMVSDGRDEKKSDEVDAQRMTI